MIHHQIYKTFCDHIYDGPDFSFPKKSCTVYVPMDQICRFFAENEQLGNPPTFNIVSGDSDLSLCYQKEHTVARDMEKWVTQNTFPDVGYSPLIIPQRYEMGQCCQHHKYSVKVDTYTFGTFPRIPKNINLWFGTNMNIDEPNIVKIPFGVPSWYVEATNKEFDNNLRFNKAYINWRNHTRDRAVIKEWARGKSWCVVKDEVDVSEYIQDILKYRYVLSPPGNGFDCFRTWETLYLGAIPVLFSGRWCDQFYHLPAVFLNKIDDLNLEYLDNMSKNMGRETDYLGEHYWEKTIRAAGDSLNNRIGERYDY